MTDLVTSDRPVEAPVSVPARGAGSAWLKWFA
jgi:hypothetical protein